MENFHVFNSLLRCYAQEVTWNTEEEKPKFSRNVFSFLVLFVSSKLLDSLCPNIRAIVQTLLCRVDRLMFLYVQPLNCHTNLATTRNLIIAFLLAKLAINLPQKTCYK